jgi:hypothetical protein
MVGVIGWIVGVYVCARCIDVMASNANRYSSAGACRFSKVVSFLALIATVILMAFLLMLDLKVSGAGSLLP